MHGRFAPIDGEFDDYIAHPKANGYRSLHTAVCATPFARAAEFQVRTWSMHEQAEGGDAAHWRYKLSAPTLA